MRYQPAPLPDDRRINERSRTSNRIDDTLSTAGVWLARIAGFPLATSWLAAAIALYVLVGACWLLVVAIQLLMRRIADATPNGQALPALYHRLSRWWFALGWPAFTGVIAIYWLMVAKPELW